MMALPVEKATRDQDRRNDRAAKALEQENIVEWYMIMQNVSSELNCTSFHG